MEKVNKKNLAEHKAINEAACAAAEAAKVAREVAEQAVVTAQKVVERATETAEKVLLFSQTMEYIQKDIAEIKLKLDQKYVSKEEFSTVRNIVYGLVSLILVAFVGAIFTLVFIK